MRKKFPYLQISGSHRDIGFAIGENFRSRIREIVFDRKNSIPNYKELRSKSQNHFLETLTYFPEYIEELTATAIASDVGVMDLFFLNTRSLYDGGSSSEMGEVIEHDKCTTVVGFGSDGTVVGHNEDWDINNINDIYILNARIDDTTFISLNYVFELPGTSASMNNWGLIQGINEVHQKERVGIPKNFLARAVMQCKTLGDAIALVSKTNQDTGYNHVLVQGDKVIDIEIAGGETDIMINKRTPYVHTNHFLSDLKKYETYHTISSEHRFIRASEMLKPDMRKEDLAAILSDHTDTEYPICRHDATLASMIFDPTKGEVQVSNGPACLGEFTKYTI